MSPADAVDSALTIVTAACAALMTAAVLLGGLQAWEAIVWAWVAVAWSVVAWMRGRLDG